MRHGDVLPLNSDEDALIFSSLVSSLINLHLKSDTPDVRLYPILKKILNAPFPIQAIIHENYPSITILIGLYLNSASSYTFFDDCLQLLASVSATAVGSLMTHFASDLITRTPSLSSSLFENLNFSSVIKLLSFMSKQLPDLSRGNLSRGNMALSKEVFPGQYSALTETQFSEQVCQLLNKIFTKYEQTPPKVANTVKPAPSMQRLLEWFSKMDQLTGLRSAAMIHILVLFSVRFVQISDPSHPEWFDPCTCSQLQAMAIGFLKGYLQAHLQR